ncbi:MAG: GerAB/ArcD/ProY family transporter [Oscillospiraceae bacterium]
MNGLKINPKSKDGSLDGYKAQISGFQLFQILFVSRIFSLLSYNTLTKDESSPIIVFISIIISLILDFIIITPILFLQKNNKGANIIDSALEISPILGKIIASFYFIFSIFICAITVSKFEFFLTSSVYVEASHILIVIMFIIVSVYAVYLGIEALSRFTFFVFLGFIITFLFIIIANIQNFDLTNIFYKNFDNSTNKIFNTVFSLSFKNTEYFLLLLCAGEVRGKVRKSVISWLVISTIVFEIISFAILASLGKTADIELFPFYLLSGTAEISVFQRLDALHIAIWILIAFVKTSIFIFYSCRALKYLIPLKLYGWALPFTGIIITIISGIISLNLIYLENFTNFVFNIISYLIFIFVIPIFIIILKRIKIKKSEGR